MSKKTVGQGYFEDPRLKEAKKLISDVIKDHSAKITEVKAADPELKMSYENLLDQTSKIKHINFQCYYIVQEENMARVFPDEDFCLYVNYPFDQLVLISQYCTYSKFLYLLHNNIDFSCTYLWLVKYYQKYYDAFYYQNIEAYYSYGKIDQTTSMITKNLYRVLSDVKYNASLKRCNFDKMSQNCNRSAYKVKDIWGRFDYMILNTKLEISIRIASYVVSLLGIVTNLIVIITILAKKNTESFKDIKHYSYLWINSLFSILMLFIQLRS